MTGRNTAKIIQRLNSGSPSIRLICDAPMSNYTSFRAGGSADLLIEPSGEDELRRLLALMNEEGCPYMILGRGTNILVRDGGYRGAMIRMGDPFQQIQREGNMLICGSGATLSAVARRACEEGLGGFEFASGIPGTIGGAVFMNAGAYGSEMADVIRSVRLITADGSSVREAGVDELDMGYRRSAIQASGEIVVSASIMLEEADPEEIRSRMAELMEKRNSKQPVNLPSAGSFFKRPEGHYAGRLIEDAGLGGLTVGGAQVSQLHKGFIVNAEDATATDILRLMDIVRLTVMDRFGVLLEPEVRIVGEERK